MPWVLPAPGSVVEDGFSWPAFRIVGGCGHFSGIDQGKLPLPLLSLSWLLDPHIDRGLGLHRNATGNGTRGSALTLGDSATVFFASTSATSASSIDGSDPTSSGPVGVGRDCFILLVLPSLLPRVGMRDKVHQLRPLNRQWLAHKIIGICLCSDLMLPFLYLFLVFSPPLLAPYPDQWCQLGQIPFLFLLSPLVTLLSVYDGGQR